MMTTRDELDIRMDDILKNAEQIRQQRQGLSDVYNFGNMMSNDAFNLIANAREHSSDPERATQMVSQAMLLSNSLGVSIDDAMKNMGLYTQQLLGKEPDYTKTGFRAMSDRLKIGSLGIDYQELTYKYKQLDLDEDAATNPEKKRKIQEEKEKVKAQINDKLSQMDELRKYLPDGMWNELIGGLMENLPQQWDMFKNLAYGAAATTAGLAVGSIITGMPLAAPIALGSAVTLLNSGAVALGASIGSFLRMKDLTEGAMYYELVSQGVEKNIANWASYADGLIEAGIEMGLGVTHAVGGAVFKGLGISKIAKQAAMKAYGSGTMGRIGMFATKLLKTGGGEGAEEGFQRAASDLTKCVVSAISKSGYDPDVTLKKSIKEGMYEVLMGAWVGTVLGVFPVSLEFHADMKYAKSLMKDAETTTTKKEFIENHKGDDEFKDMKEKDTENFLGRVYDRNQSELVKRELNERKQRDTERNERRNALNKEKEELQGKEETEYNKQRLEAIEKELADLDVREKEDSISDARKTTERSREKFINEQTPENRESYEKDRQAQDELEREASKPELVKEYEYLGEKDNKTDEEWDRYQELDQNQQVRRWYERQETTPQDENPDWQKTPEEIETPEQEYMKAEGVGRLVQQIKEKTNSKVSDAEAEAIAGAMLNPLAKSLGMTPEEVLETKFNPEIARQVEVGVPTQINGEEITLKKPDEGKVVKGAVYFDPKDGRAIVLLTKDADASTWVHEVGHIIRRHIGGEMKTELEGYYGVKNGNWTVAQEERFTENLTTYMMTGQAPTSGLKKVFRIIADALLDVYHSFSGREAVSDDIRNFFDRLFTEPKSAYDIQNEYDYEYSVDSLLYQTTEDDYKNAMAELNHFAPKEKARISANLEKFKGYPFSSNREEFDNWLDASIESRNHQSIKLAIDYNLLKENGYDSIIANLYTKYNEQNGERNATAIEYGVFEPNQIKSADPVTYDDNGNVIPLSERFNEDNTSLLYSEREQTYEEATEQGNYVPDDILIQYRGQEWADAEIQAREDYRNTIISDYIDYVNGFDQFVSDMKADDTQERTDDYYQSLWASAADRRPKDVDAFKNMSKRMLESILRNLNKLQKDNRLRQTPEGFIAEAMKNYDEEKGLSEEEYNNIMAEINSSPDKTISSIAALFSDEDEFAEMMKAIATTPDVFALREINKYVKSNKHYKETTARKVDEDIKTLKGVLRDYRLNYITKEESEKRISDVKAKFEGKLEIAKERETYLRDTAKYEKYKAKQKAQNELELAKYKSEMQLNAEKLKAENEVAYYQDKFAELKQAYKDKALYDKCMRMIYRKISGMCHPDQADEIRAIQNRYSKSSMSDKIRKNLEAAVEKETDPKKKAKLQAMLDKESFRDMPLDDVVEIANHVAELRHEGLARRMDYIAERSEFRWNWIDRLRASLGNVEKRDKTGSIEGRKNKGKLRYQFMGNHVDIQRITEFLGKDWVELLQLPIEAHRNELEYKYKKRVAVLEAMKRLGITAETLSTPDKNSINGLTYTHDVSLSHYIYTKNSDSYAALVGGNFEGRNDNEIGLKRIDNILKDSISKLTKGEKEFGDWLIKSYSDADWKLLEHIIRTVENRSVERSDNYFPMKRILEDMKNPMEEPLIDAMGRTRGRMGVQKGFSYNRLHNIPLEKQKPLQLGALGIYMRSIEDQAHYIAFAQLSKDLNYIYKNLKEDVAAKYGTEFADDLQRWIDKVVNPRAYNAIYKQQTILDKAMRNLTIAKLAFNAVSILKQLPSVILFLPYTDGISMLSSIHQYIEDRKGVTDFIKDRSPDFRFRSMEDTITQTLDNLADPNAFIGKLGKLKRAKTKIVDAAGMSPYSIFDGIACTIGWKAVYDHEMSNGATEEQAIRQADKAFLKTQPQAVDMYSPIIFDKQRYRPWLMFQRQAYQIMQMIWMDIPNTWKNKDLEVKKRLSIIMSTIGVVALEALIMNWISRKFKLYGDEDDDKFFKEGWVWDLFKGTFSSALTNVPLVGTPLTSLIQWSNYTSSGFVDPVTTTLTDVGHLVHSSIKKGELDADKTAKVITDIMGAAGLPEVMTYRAYKALDEDGVMDKLWTVAIGTPLGGKKREEKENLFQEKIKGGMNAN